MKSMPSSLSWPGSGNGGCCVATPMWNIIALKATIQPAIMDDTSAKRLPFIVKIAPRFLSCRKLKNNATQGPNVHGTVTAAFVILDDFRRHVHGRASKTVHSQTTTQSSFGRATRALHRPLVFREYLGRTKVDEFDHSEVIQKNVSRPVSSYTKFCTDEHSLSGLISRWTIPLECRYARPSSICMVYTWIMPSSSIRPYSNRAARLPPWQYSSKM